MKNLPEFDFSNVDTMKEAAIIQEHVQFCDTHEYTDCRCNQLTAYEYSIIAHDLSIHNEYKNECFYHTHDEDAVFEDELINFDKSGRQILDCDSSCFNDFPVTESSTFKTGYTDINREYMSSEEYNDYFFYTNYSERDLHRTGNVNYHFYLNDHQYMDLRGTTDALARYVMYYSPEILGDTLMNLGVQTQISKVTVQGSILDSDVPVRAELHQIVIIDSSVLTIMKEAQRTRIVKRWNHKMKSSIKAYGSSQHISFDFSLIIYP